MSDNLQNLLGILIWIALFVIMLTIITVISRKRARKWEAERLNAIKAIDEGGPSVMAYITEINRTSSYINHQPVMKVSIAIFPENGPQQDVWIKQAFNYQDLPAMQPGTALYITTKEDESGTVKRLSILGVMQKDWRGDGAVKEAYEGILERVNSGRTSDAEGVILSAQETGATLHNIPVYKYRVSFQTKEGRRIEEDTYQTTRQWLRDHRRDDPNVTITYSEIDNNDFLLYRE